MKWEEAWNDLYSSSKVFLPHWICALSLRIIYDTYITYTYLPMLYKVSVRYAYYPTQQGAFKLGNISIVYLSVEQLI